MKMKLLAKYGVALVVGGLLGLLYWQQIGCISGSCPITSSPVNSSIYGGLMGVLTLNLFQNKPARNNESK